MEADRYILELNRLLTEKQALLKEILELTRRQKEAISKDDLNKLEILLAKKQTRMNAVDKLDCQFLELSESLKNELGINSLEELASKGIPGTGELKASTSAVLDILREIKKIDDENIAAVEREMADVKRKLNQASNYRKVRSAYFRPGQATVNSLFDKKG
jgi:FlgN protein.